MAWVLESTLFERERSLTFEERLMLVIRHGATGRPSVELLKYQAEHGQREGSNGLNR